MCVSHLNSPTIWSRSYDRVCLLVRPCLLLQNCSAAVQSSGEFTLHSFYDASGNTLLQREKQDFTSMRSRCLLLLVVVTVRIKLFYWVQFNMTLSIFTVGLPFCILTSQHKPFKRGFFCNDESIRYPLKDDTISYQLLGGVMIPFCLIVVSRPGA